MNLSSENREFLRFVGYICALLGCMLAIPVSLLMAGFSGWMASYDPADAGKWLWQFCGALAVAAAGLWGVVWLLVFPGGRKKRRLKPKSAAG